MDCRAAVLTGQGAAALATLQVTGKDAEYLLAQSLSVAPPPLGQIRLCHLLDRDGVIDQITVAHEAPQTFTLHSHGNPLIVERIVTCLRQAGVTLVAATDLMSPRDTLLEMEIDRAIASTKTLLGSRLVAQQRTQGLLPLAQRWYRDDSPSLINIKDTCRVLLSRYPAALYALNGCTVAIVGPPNSGKSTLFNRLLGIDKSIVADMQGTTRDWVEGELTSDDLHLTLLDTAGLDVSLTQSATGHIDRRAQGQVHGLLERADYYLLVLDVHETVTQMQSLPLEKLPPQRTIVLLNKDDLPHRLPCEVTRDFPYVLSLRALHDIGTSILLDTLRALTGLATLDVNQPTPFTDRQQALLAALATAEEKTQTQSILQELLHG